MTWLTRQLTAPPNWHNSGDNRSGHASDGTWFTSSDDGRGWLTSAVDVSAGSSRGTATDCLGTACLGTASSITGGRPRAPPRLQCLASPHGGVSVSHLDHRAGGVMIIGVARAAVGADDEIAEVAAVD